MGICDNKVGRLIVVVVVVMESLQGGAGGVPPLRALVPLKTSFTEFVSWSGSPLNASFNGFCVDVFRNAALRLPFPLPYTLLPFGDSISTPSYDDMIQMLLHGKADVIVADITINMDRLKIVDFTQPYMPSALLMVTPFRFTSLTVFFSQQESVMTHAGRFVTVAWLLVVLIFTSSYTASLASTLSAQLPVPTIQGFEFLLKSSVPIGYHGGSFIENYLKMLGIKEGRLKSLGDEEQYADALRLGPKAGGVGAIVDEHFGFAFAKNSTLTDEMSMAILSLAQDGTLQGLKDKWVGSSQCNVNAQATSDVRLSSFGGLFIILATVYGMCVVWRVLTWQAKSERMQARIVSMTRVLSVRGASRGAVQDQSNDVNLGPP